MASFSLGKTHFRIVERSLSNCSNLQIDFWVVEKMEPPSVLPGTLGKLVQVELLRDQNVEQQLGLRERLRALCALFCR